MNVLEGDNNNRAFIIVILHVKNDDKMVVRNNVTLQTCHNLFAFPEPSISWLKNGRKLEKPEVVVREEKGGRVSIVKFTVMGTDDAGVYTCKARNLVTIQ
jgi:hypothetical protein